MFGVHHGVSSVPSANRVSQSAPPAENRRMRFAPARIAVQFLDRTLRFILGIVEFCDREDCILRIATRRAPADVCIPGRIELKWSDKVVELHFWNEHLPAAYRGESPLSWAVRFRKQVRLSLSLLATQATTDPSIASAKAFYARLVLPLDGRSSKCRNVANAYGFSVSGPPRLVFQELHDLFENLLIRALLWVFHPGNLMLRHASLERVYWWISREDLLRRYKDAAGPVTTRRTSDANTSPATHKADILEAIHSGTLRK